MHGPRAKPSSQRDQRPGAYTSPAPQGCLTWLGPPTSNWDQAVIDGVPPGERVHALAALHSLSVITNSHPTIAPKWPF